MIKTDDITIYCMYHNDNILKEFNIKELPSYYKLFNVNYLNIPGDSINYLNRYLCELCGYYYIWKNNIYSPYVGFCHYRRLYLSLGLDNLEKYGVHYYMPMNKNIEDLSIINYNNNFTKLYNYLCSLNKFNNDQLYNIIYNNEPINGPWKLSSIFKWEHFIDICNIMFGFLEYIEPEYRNVNIHNSRKIAWEFEAYFLIIVGLYFNNIKIEPTFLNKIILVNSNDLNINNINNIIKFVKYNNKCGSRIYLLTNKLTNNDIKNCENTFLINSIDDIPIWLKDAKIFKLNLNQYIETLDPIEFNNDKYTIKNIL